MNAKYRGAFCEAKIKTVKRMVKVKVTLKGDSTSQVVQDDQVKGPLRVGSTVEVKTNEGLSSEGVIGKLTDASLYTVVFDDGDEKTLRRTSLCLKGERHFAESETLDQLPLTNPEHFGTPVIGKKTNRGGRRSQYPENESSSSEDEEEDRRRLNDELLGKVSCIENEDEQPGSWYLALVVSPSCNDELVVKRDQCLVRSFGDAKFGCVVFRCSPVCLLTCLPLCSFGQPEEELDPEERDHFLQQLYKFMEDRGTPINKPPVLGYKDLNLFKLFRLVYQQGGCHKIESGTVWKQVYMDLGIPILNSAASYNVKTAYKKYLYGFEEYCRSASIAFRTIHHNNPRPPTTPANLRQAGVELKESCSPELKVEHVDDKMEEVESESESEKEEVKERQLSPRVRKPLLPFLLFVLLLQETIKTKLRPVMCLTLFMDGVCVCVRSEGEEDEDSLAGTKVRVKYGRGKTQKIYEAHIKKTDVDNGEQFYLVHYYGWNVRYDEWVKADRIIWPPEKGTKKRQRRKGKVSSSTFHCQQHLFHAEESGNSTDDSESEDTPDDKKPSPWRGRVEAPPSHQQKEEEEETCENIMPTVDNENTLATGTAGQLPAASEPQSPSMPQDKFLSQSMKKEADEGEEPSVEAAKLPVHSEKEAGTSPLQEGVTRTLSVHESSKMSPGQEVVIKTSPRRASPLPDRTNKMSPSTTDKHKSSPEKTPPVSSPLSAPAEEEDNRSTPLSSPRLKGRRSNIRETGSETPPRTPLCSLSPAQHVSPSNMAAVSSPPRGSPPADSDTDSASEEEEAGLLEERSSALKRKAADQRTAEKKLRPERRQEEAASPKTPPAASKMAPSTSPETLSSPLRREESERRSTVKTEEWPRLAEETLKEVSGERLTGGITKESEVHAGMPAPAVEAHGPAPSEEAEPQIGPEALVSRTSPGSHPCPRSLQSLVVPACRLHRLTVKTNNPSLLRGPTSGPSSSVTTSAIFIIQTSAPYGSPPPPPPSPPTDELDSMSSTERISFLQDKLQEIRKYYMTLKSEVASIDRRRKRLKKKEREVSNTTASTSSGSSDTGMSPSSASPTQNTVAVECR
uniref:AT-rich interactive domain 4A n=1 Tax=Labrus bergylta TaxID=56723 RepID=A0A3Q3MT50_9LABR